MEVIEIYEQLRQTHPPHHISRPYVWMGEDVGGRADSGCGIDNMYSFNCSKEKLRLCNTVRMEIGQYL